MIDIHAHILPGVDDGAADLEDAVLMAELAVESGVGTIIATPHGNLSGVWGEEVAHLHDVRDAYEELCGELERRGTTRQNVFAGGDAVTGAATVILAMGAGKKAAASIAKRLLKE